MRIPLRTRCIYCGTYTAPVTTPPSRAPRTCAEHKPLPGMDWTYKRRTERMPG